MRVPDGPLRFGLVGTGHWARITHAPALASVDGIELVAVWGRNAAAASALANEHGAVAYTDIEAFLAAVDAVAFSVPPGVQATIGLQAARAGKHLLLEKPIALSEPEARALVAAIEEAHVASVVFFTARFQPEIRSWLADIAGRGPLLGGQAVWLASLFAGHNPFDTPWRRDKGGLWDIGPHVVSMLWACLGPVRAVTAVGGAGDLTHLIFEHEGGATSTATVSLGAPPAAGGFDFSVWGESGMESLPAEGHDSKQALCVALQELVDSARSSKPEHPCDARFGLEIVRVLAEAERQIRR
jgi:predicted dehydrogenase